MAALYAEVVGDDRVTLHDLGLGVATLQAEAALYGRERQQW